jgi:hypothetical protein
MMEKTFKCLLAAVAMLACASASAADVMKLIRQHDNVATPGFFKGQVTNDCASLIVRGDGLSGTINGHSIDVSFDPISRVLQESLDGETSIAYLDEHLNVIGGRDAKGNEFVPTHHSQAEINERVKNDLPRIRAALRACGWDKTLAKTAGTKCLNVVTFDYPAGGKDCIPDDYGDPGYWDGVLGGGFDTTQFSNWQDYAACMEQQSQCKEFCDNAYAIANIECLALGEVPIAAIVCASVAYGLWQNCKNGCPQCSF